MAPPEDTKEEYHVDILRASPSQQSDAYPESRKSRMKNRKNKSPTADRQGHNAHVPHVSTDIAGQDRGAPDTPILTGTSSSDGSSLPPLDQEGAESGGSTFSDACGYVSSIFGAIYQNVTFSLSHRKEIQWKVEELHHQMATAEDRETWLEAAVKLDILEGKEEWKCTKESDLYDWNQVESRIKQLQSLRRQNDIHGLIFSMRGGVYRNIGGTAKPELFKAAHSGTKYLIDDYCKEVTKTLEYMCDNDFLGFPFEKKLAFFSEMRQTYGRSALLLSGGATLGLYHLGVIKALHQANCLPNVISGSSAGAIITAIVAVHTPEELDACFESNHWNLNFFDPSHSLRRKLWRLLHRGVLMDIEKLKASLRINIGDLTFKEAYERTKRIVNISVCAESKHSPPVILNYLTAPNVLLWSAAAASCALKFLYEPTELLAKDRLGNIVPYHPEAELLWSDGSVEVDLPMQRLSELFNVNHFLVSQVNPHVLPFLTSDAQTWSAVAKRLVVGELKHRLFQIEELGILPDPLTSIFSLVNQKYQGDITIVPASNIKDYLGLVSNPTNEMIQHGTREGERNTWPLIPRIFNQLHIELTLEKCVRTLKSSISWATDEE
eukprot:GFYU01003765.1.p1 GENE.GFYU01003765.1~~GFYU01003765.1.p1  ORF type:complete len:607 (+),score=129.45 GFYU01003765.1:224-2044(+)